ncbi:hypothetical protein AURDEDRAFT_184880 [Auricularia subglabra TFB-10046 SS5]|nr:hypothetical protein AURDEDRAFT_184880 [Auricularia subglabra TFB-10046 SS5]
MLNSFATVLAKSVYLQNAQLSLQDRLPPELWLDIWKRLSMVDRFSVSHVSSRWRQLSTQCPDLWTSIDCYTEHNSAGRTGGARYSNGNFVAIALNRAKGMDLSLSFYLQSRCGCGERSFSRLTALLAPFSRDVVRLTFITCSLEHAHTILGHLQPLSSLRLLSCGPKAMKTYWAGQPILPCVYLPQLTTLELPTTQEYHYVWSPGSSMDPFSGGQQPPPRTKPLFPSVRVLHFAPGSQEDALRALRDCPNLVSLGLSLTHLSTKDGHADTLRRSVSGVAHLDLRDVSPYRTRRILQMFASEKRSWCHVVLKQLPRVSPAHSSDDWDAPPDVTPRRPLRKRAEEFYLRLADTTKRMIRMKKADEPALEESEPPPDPAPDAPMPYQGKGLRWLASHVCDLGARVDATFYTQRQWGTSDIVISLQAADQRGLSRGAALQACDIDAVPEFLTHTWKNHLPVRRVDHFVVETGLFPLLVSTLPAGGLPATSLTLLFRTLSDVAGATNRLADNAHAFCIGPAAGARFPNLRVLNFGPRDVSAADDAVLSALDVAVFVKSLGAKLPLESLTIRCGVVVDHESALNGLAQSVILQADPIILSP